MKILTIETEVKYIALKRPFITALRRVDNIEFVRVSVVCEDSSVTFGEAPATKAITGEDIDDIVASIERVKDSFIAKTPKEAIKLLDILEIGSSAKAALDMAFFSLENSFKRDKNIKLQTDITVSLRDEDLMVADALEFVKNGMSILKLKFGSDIDHAIRVTKRVATLDAKLLVDANQAWSLEDSLRYIDAIKDVKIELIEQPVKAQKLEALKTITNYSNIPILADEAIFTLIDAKEVIESSSADMINIKLMKCGGVSKAIEILEYARKKGVKVMLGSMLEGPISINIALHLAMSYRDVIEYIDLDSPLLYKTPSHELEFEFDGSYISYIS